MRICTYSSEDGEPVQILAQFYPDEAEPMPLTIPSLPLTDPYYSKPVIRGFVVAAKATIVALAWMIHNKCVVYPQGACTGNQNREDLETQLPGRER